MRSQPDLFGFRRAGRMNKPVEPESPTACPRSEPTLFIYLAGDGVDG